MTDFKNAPGATTQVHRTYLYYNSNTANRQYFYKPRFEEVEDENANNLINKLVEKNIKINSVLIRAAQ